MQIKCYLNPKYEKALKEYNILQYDNDFVARHRTKLQDLQLLSMVKDVSKEYQNIKDNYKVPEIDVNKPIDVNIIVTEFIPGFSGGRIHPCGYIHFTVGACGFREPVWQSDSKREIRRADFSSYINFGVEYLEIIDLFKEESKEDLLQNSKIILRQYIGPEEEQTFENIEKPVKKKALQKVIDMISRGL